MFGRVCNIRYADLGIIDSRTAGHADKNHGRRGKTNVFGRGSIIQDFPNAG